MLRSGITNRPAIYPTILNGLSANYFASLKYQKALEEVNTNFSVIKEVLFGK